MDDLVELAVAAHGGLQNWIRRRSVDAQLRIDGGIWGAKGVGGKFTRIKLLGKLWAQEVQISSMSGDWLSVFTPDNVRVEAWDGEVVDERRAPRRSFPVHNPDAKWDDIHAIYFCSYALWTYITIPFLYTYPGFSAEELPEWEENGEIWRRLKVTFPISTASHCREQISYFGGDGLLRRHDYTVDVMGGVTGANYATNYRVFDGVVVPASRRVFAYDAQRKRIDHPLLVSIDIESMQFR
ncbi:hypothetical protein P3T18_003065 [Paraburkholderia sp. GAS199]|uniref:hypothetical protein n=1 Tax=Paraburkholderia sp. GAS199 TaxID=3035126 RepID=UPI003D1F4467